MPKGDPYYVGSDNNSQVVVILVFVVGVGVALCGNQLGLRRGPTPRDIVDDIENAEDGVRHDDDAGAPEAEERV